MGLFDWLRRGKGQEQDECEAWRTQWEQLQGIRLVQRIEQTANNLGTHYREQQTRDPEDRPHANDLDAVTLLRCDLKALRLASPDGSGTILVKRPAPPARYSIIDTFDRFLSYWASARERPVIRRIELWKTSYMAAYPELWEKQIREYQDEGLDWREIAAKKVFPKLVHLDI